MNYARSDSYSNLITGLGKKNVDKNTGIIANGEYWILDDAYLTNLYISDGLGTRIIDIVANDSTRNGWTLKDDTDKKIKNELSRISFVTAVNKAMKFTRLYRGAIIVMTTERGDLEQPLNKNNGAIRQLRVYSASRIEIMPTDIISDPISEYFDEVEIFKIRKRDGGYLLVHRSRCLIFKGELVPDYETASFDTTYDYWGLSAMQRVYERLGYFGSAEQGLSNLMQEIVVGKYTVSNLEQILAMNNADAINKITTRLEIMNASKSILHAVLLGKDEKYERDSLNLTGVDKVVEFQMMGLSAVSNIPITRLFGKSPAGMNATGQSDERIYYDDVQSTQVNKMQSEMNKCIKYVGNYVYGLSTEKYGVDEFNSLWELTEKDYAEMEKMKAEANNIYIQTGVLTPEEVTIKEFPEMDTVGRNLEISIPPIPTPKKQPINTEEVE